MMDDMTQDAEDILGQVQAWREAGEQVALATVVATWGSSPRPAGSQMAVTRSGRIVGSVSGGCVESAVTAAAMETLADQRPQLLDYGISSERAWEVGLACGGQLQVFVGRGGMTPDIRTGLIRARHDKRAVVLATRLEGGVQMILPSDAATPALNDAADRALRADTSTTLQIEGERWFLHVHNMPVRLFLIGAVHISQALVRLAAPIGLGAIVVDPRPALATAERFPGITLMADWPDEALDLAQLDARSAVVALTHDPKLDDPALDRALRSPAFYIGALGSRRSHAARLERLAELGHTPDSLARIRGPVGLPIAAVTAPEIALSILAELVAVRRGGRPR